MKLLAIETSCEHASIALLMDGQMTCRELQGHANHSERLLPCIGELLAEAGLVASALDAVAFGSGPGAFTGLRLACGVAQGLAMGAGLGVVPVSSLAALAQQVEQPRVLALVDARMGEIYVAGYARSNGYAEEILAPACLRPEDVRPDGEWWMVGSALQAYPSLCPAGQPEVLGRDAALVPRAQEVALLAARDVAQSGVLAPELAVPLYVRDKVALTTAERLARGGRA